MDIPEPLITAFQKSEQDIPLHFTFLISSVLIWIFHIIDTTRCSDEHGTPGLVCRNVQFRIEIEVWQKFFYRLKINRRDIKQTSNRAFVPLEQLLAVTHRQQKYQKFQPMDRELIILHEVLIMVSR